MNEPGSRVITLAPTTSRLGVNTRNSSQPHTSTSTAARNGCCLTLPINQLFFSNISVFFRQKPFPAVYPADFHRLAQSVIKGGVVFIEEFRCQHFGAIAQVDDRIQGAALVVTLHHLAGHAVFIIRRQYPDIFGAQQHVQTLPFCNREVGFAEGSLQAEHVHGDGVIAVGGIHPAREEVGFAHKARGEQVGGAFVDLAGVPSCWMWPSLSTTTRSDIDSASSWS